jgi:hypothetical protein
MFKVLSYTKLLDTPEIVNTVDGSFFYESAAVKGVTGENTGRPISVKRNEYVVNSAPLRNPQDRSGDTAHTTICREELSYQ